MPCPVCRVRRLHAHAGVLFCGCGRLRLDLGREGAGTLAWAAARLADAWRSHRAAGCGAELVYGQHSVGGAQGLWAACEACGLVQLVL